jgi:hypothetical protein
MALICLRFWASLDLSGSGCLEHHLKTYSIRSHQPNQRTGVINGLEPCSEFEQGCLINSARRFYGTCSPTFWGWSQHFFVFPANGPNTLSGHSTDLAEVLAVWEHLPKHLRAAIRALIKTSVKDKDNEHRPSLHASEATIGLALGARRRTRSGFERPFFRLAASGCIDDKTNIACFAVFASLKNDSLSDRRQNSPTDS